MPQLDAVFSALGDGTRRAIVAKLAAGEAPLSEVAEPFAMSLTAVSKHVRMLSEAGLVTVEKRGRTRFCRLDGEGMRQAVEWLNDYRAFWENQLQSLEDYLALEDNLDKETPK